MLLAVCGESQQQTVPTPAVLSTSYSNYGIYAKLRDDRLTTWHLSFLELGDTLENFASRYRWFCLKYRSQKKAGGRLTH